MSSTKKLAVMLLTKSLYDDRIRGTLLYHGASTGRWSGRLIQPQNFPRGGLSPREVDQALELASLHNLEAFSVIFGDPMNAAKNCLRGMIKAAPGKDLIVADYSAIEARVVCWLAGQEDVLQLYRENKDAYKDMASFLYGVDYAHVNDAQRFMGKSIVLGCGFGMGWQTFLATSQKDGNVISEAMAQNAVVSFRERYYLVEKLWGDIDRAAKRVIRTGKPERVGKVFMFIKDIFFCVRLPSGRCLYYPYPRIEDRKTKFGNSKSITFQSTKKKGEVWLREGTYGGKMVENITQAVARDVMSSGMMNAENNGYPMITTVHDEPVSEVEEGTGSVEEFIKLICTLPAWAKGLPIKAEGYRAKRYKK
jgi:DNA polymerase